VGLETIVESTFVWQIVYGRHLHPYVLNYSYNFVHEEEYPQ